MTVVNDIASWVVTGAVTGVVAPGIVVATRTRPLWRRVSPPAAVAGPAFVVVHGAITISLIVGFDLPAWLGLHVALLTASLAYWLPLQRLDRVGQFLYLFLTSPLLDLAGVVVVGLGQPSHGLAMIVGMLPLNGVAVLVGWRWLTEEDRAGEHLPMVAGVEPGEAGSPQP